MKKRDLGLKITSDVYNTVLISHNALASGSNDSKSNRGLAPSG